MLVIHRHRSVVYLVALRYEYSVDQLIIGFKCRQQLTYALVLGKLVNSDAGICAVRLQFEHL